MEIKIYIEPQFKKPDDGDGGIRRVVEAQKKYLPKLDFRIVDNPDQADVIANHGSSATWRPGIPVVNHNHGLYWSRQDWGANFHEVNKQVAGAMSLAVAHTCPSEWVAVSLRRGMLISPEVVYHGVDVEDFSVADKPGNFVLWNKARQDPVSDPQDMFTVSRMLEDIPFVSTVGVSSDNITAIGKMPYKDMIKLLTGTGVYLATPRETFGIGIIEALASGVPVAGWDWGGLSEILIDGETGYLAPPGDYEALAEAITKCFAERERLSPNCRKDAEERWSWLPRIKQYATIYRKVHKEFNRKRPKVSVLVTAHNLGKYLEDTLESVESQTDPDWECIIADDDSKDDTPEIGKRWAEKDPRFKYHRTPSNLGLSLSRNFAFLKSKGKYVIPLDADDMLEENTFDLLTTALDEDPNYHIVYGHLDVVDENGENPKRNDGWPFKEYAWRGQMAHLNQMPYAAMMRREVMERGGGYRYRHNKAEDAAMWCRLTSFGFRAKKVTERSLLIYRNRGDSKSKKEYSEHSGQEGPPDGDWTSWYPWRLAGSPREASEKRMELMSGEVPNSVIVPFGAQGSPPPSMHFWNVNDYSYPAISVIVAVGPNHAKYVIDAVESLVAQIYPDWECIVVNDTGKKWKDDFTSPVAGAPYAKVYKTPKGGMGPSAARNLGAKHAIGEALLFLDADDYLLPNALERMAAYMEEMDGIIYTGWLRNKMDGSAMEYYQPAPFECGKVLNRLQHAGSSILIPRKVHDKIGGWDEDCPGWEDWDYLIACQAVAGACSYVIKEPLFVYRFFSGEQRERSYDIRQEVSAYIYDKWRPYYQETGGKEIMCGCKGAKQVATLASSMYSSSGNNLESSPTEESVAVATSKSPAGETMVMLEYQGEHAGPITIRGPVSQRPYRFGRESHKRMYVLVEDARPLLERRVRSEHEFTLVEDETAPEESPAEASQGPLSQPMEPEFPSMPVGA